MIVQCPKCLTKLQSSEEHLGKRLRCSECGQRFHAAPSLDEGEFQAERQPIAERPKFRPKEIPPPRQPVGGNPVEDNERLKHRMKGPVRQESPSPAPTLPKPVPPAPAPPVDEDEDDSVWADEPSPLDAFRQPAAIDPSSFRKPAPQTSDSPPQVSIGFGSIADFAFDRSKISWAMLWGVIWSASMAVSGVLAKYVSLMLAPPLMILATWICYIAIISGISRLAALKAETGRTPQLSGAWELVLKRAISLFLGTLAIGLAVALAATFVFGGIYALSHVPYAGGILGGILFIPTFMAILFALSLLLNMYLLPIIIGVEDCTAAQAFQILRRLVTKNGFALLGRYFSALGSIIPFTLFSAVLTVGALAGAVALCGGEQVLTIAEEGIPIGSMLQVASGLFVIATWMAFVVVFATVSFTLIYCESCVRMNFEEING